MKFTKQEAIEKIKANFSKKVEKIDKWERTIKETVDTMCDLVGDESEIELDTFAEKVEKQLMTQKGHIDKEASSVASDLQNQIEDLKKKLPKETKSKKKKDDDTDDEPDDELSQLKERLKKLEDEQQAEKTQKTISQKLEDLAAEIEKKGVKNKKWIRSMLEKAKIDENTDIEKEADSYLEMYNEFFSELPDDDVTPREAGKATRLERIKEVVKKAGEARKQDGI